ncbi:MAG: hypothetical protein ABSB19_11200 [Methylomonas sp.]|jgi:hypothetical protein
MTGNIPDASDCLRSEGWKQGCVIHPQYVQQLTSASIDFYNKPVSAEIWLVVLTQDCDLVRHTDVEPFVEILAMQQMSNISSNPMRGQSARSLHLSFEMNAELYWFECNIHDRFRIKKESLCGMGCDTSRFLAENELRHLRQWLARRYTRAAFPDYFEKHLASTKDPVKRLFKSAAAKLISTIYIAIDNEDADPDEDYFIHVILTALDKYYDEASKRDLIDEFEEQFISVFNGRPHIRFALKNPDEADSYDVKVMPEEDVTLNLLRKYKWFDADYRSVDEDTIAPPDGIDSN